MLQFANHASIVTPEDDKQESEEDKAIRELAKRQVRSLMNPLIFSTAITPPEETALASFLIKTLNKLSPPWWRCHKNFDFKLPMLATDHTKVLQWRLRVVSLPVSVLTATVNIGYFISDGLIQSYLPGWIYVSDRFCLQFLISSLYRANVPWLFRIMNHLLYDYN